jgi:hypothetical protein
MAVADTVGNAPVTGRKSGVGTSAVQLTTASAPAVRGVLLIPAAANAGNVYFGGAATITANVADASDGCQVPASGVLVPVANATQVYVVADAVGQVVFWTAL